MTDAENRPVPGERAQSEVQQTSTGNTTAKRGLVVLAVVAFVGLFLYFGNTGQRVANPDDARQTTIRQTTRFEPAEAPLPSPAAPPVQPVVPAPQPPVQPAPEPVVDELLESARRAPVLAFNKPSRSAGGAADRGGVAAPASAFAYPDAPDDLDGGRGGSARNDLQARLEVTTLQGSRASTLGNRNFVVAMGNSIPCVLETAMSSDVPGFASCVTNRDVMSDNGKVILMEKGTQVVGEFRGGLKRGQRRLFVLWNRAKTPKGVIVKLASPGTDALGRSGFDGEIDSHFLERFGGAILLSVVGDATSYLAGKLEDSDVEVRETSSASKDAAAIAVEQSINIPPTLYKNQGEVVSIFVARDLDFSDVYALRVTETPSEIYDRAVTGDFWPRQQLVTKP